MLAVNRRLSCSALCFTQVVVFKTHPSDVLRHLLLCCLCSGARSKGASVLAHQVTHRPVPVALQVQGCAYQLLPDNASCVPNNSLLTCSHAIVSSSVGPEYYVSIMSFVDKTQLEPGCSILLHNKVSSSPMLLVLKDSTSLWPVSCTRCLAVAAALSRLHPSAPTGCLACVPARCR